MLDLYQQEIETHGQALDEGLLSLESDPGDPAHIESLMRAAHSIKGASRIVGLDIVASVAHVLEDVFESIGKGQIRIDNAAVDVLLEVADLLKASGDKAADELSGWLGDSAAKAGQLIDSLNAILKGTYTSSGAAAEEPVAAVPEPVAEAAVNEPVQAPSPKPPGGDQSPLPAARQNRTEPSATRQAVRVSAQSLNKIMGLAAECLVETRRFEKFTEGLLRLKTQHLQLQHLFQSVAKNNGADTAADWSQLEESLREGMDGITRQISQFDQYARRNILLSDRLYREALYSRLRPFSDAVQGYPRLVRDLARSLSRQIELKIEGRDTPVDRDILEKLDAPLNHLIRNACDHGLEPPAERLAAGKPERGLLRLSARHSAGMLLVEVADDGRGIDVEKVRAKIIDKGLSPPDMARNLNAEEVLEFLFLPGFSTAGQVTEISGRGVGLDVVHTLMQEVGGQAKIESQKGRGTLFKLLLPVTRSVIRALLVSIDRELYAIPLSRIQRTAIIPWKTIKLIENRQYFSLDGQNIGLVSAKAALGLAGASSVYSPTLQTVVVGERGHTYAIEVDELCGETELAVRPLDPRLGKVAGVAAAALSEEGEPVLILDTEDLSQAIEKLLAGGNLLPARSQEDSPANAPVVRKVLVVDDSLTVRETERHLLRNAGYAVSVCVDGVDGWNAVRLGNFDLIVTDVDMPRMNGFQLVEKIRADKRLANLPVIIVSYKDREEDRLRGMEAGADRYLTKSSFQDETFIAAVRELAGGA